jgi:hypothetical protein
MGQSLNELAKSRTARDIYNLSASAEDCHTASTDNHGPATPGTPEIQKRQSEDWRFQKPYLLRLP